MTPVLLAFVLHTQTAKFAWWPAFTCDAAENDCTRTQSCGVFFFGGGEVVCEGVGVGVGLGLDELGLGVGLDEPEPLDDLCVGDGLGLLCDFDELGVGDGDFVVLELGDLVGLGDFDGLGDVLGLAGFVVVNAARTALFGTDEQAVLTIGRLPTSAARASEATLAVRNAIPATAPSAVDLRISALTSATSLTSSAGQTEACPTCLSHYARPAKRPIPAHIRHLGFTIKTLQPHWASSDAHP